MDRENTLCLVGPTTPQLTEGGPTIPHELPPFYRNLERAKFVAYAALIAATWSVALRWVTAGRGFDIALVPITVGVYAVVLLTLFQRPVTGLMDRAVRIAKAKIAVLALGAALSGGTMYVLETSSSWTAYLLGSAVITYLLVNDGVWRRYRERCEDAIAKYQEMEEDGVHEKFPSLL